MIMEIQFETRFREDEESLVTAKVVLDQDEYTGDYVPVYTNVVDVAYLDPSDGEEHILSGRDLTDNESQYLESIAGEVAIEQMREREGSYVEWRH